MSKSHRKYFFIISVVVLFCVFFGVFQTIGRKVGQGRGLSRTSYCAQGSNSCVDMPICAGETGAVNPSRARDGWPFYTNYPFSHSACPPPAKANPLVPWLNAATYFVAAVLLSLIVVELLPKKEQKNG